jgi:hypothetical protein
MADKMGDPMSKSTIHIDWAPVRADYGYRVASILDGLFMGYVRRVDELKPWRCSVKSRRETAHDTQESAMMTCEKNLRTLAREHLALEARSKDVNDQLRRGRA